MWCQWGCRGWWGQRGCRGSKAWKITTKNLKVIQVLEFWCFENKNFWVESWNIILKFSTFSDRGCWGQPTLLFLKTGLMKLKCPKFLKPLGTIIQEKIWPFYPLEPFRILRFNMRHPVLPWPWKGQRTAATVPPPFQHSGFKCQKPAEK